MHIVDLYRDHCETNVLTPVPKLTRQHIDLTAFSTMKVSLATQVLSNTVANCIEQYYGNYVSATVAFLRIMNKFFDLLNVRNLNEATSKRNNDLKVYDSHTDQRLDWLEGDFLHYFEEWKAAVMTRPGDFTQLQRSKMQLSPQTLLGLEITARSVVACIRHLLAAGAPFVMTARFNQDRLEQLFGNYRHKGGSNENPTAEDVQHFLIESKVIGSAAMAPLRGNTKRNNKEHKIDSEVLTKRKRVKRFPQITASPSHHYD